MNTNNSTPTIAVIDNYDSFTYNLVHYLEDLGAVVSVFRNDAFDVDELDCFDALVLSPGPGIPSEAGLLMEVIKHYAKTKKILGVCLGHQAIAEVFGGKLSQLPKVFHGIGTPIRVLEKHPLFENINWETTVGRYHSWVVDVESLPEEFTPLALDQEGLLMAYTHKKYPLTGVQFHPESILTPEGKTLLGNWLWRL